jgi:hypothetical protein
MIGSEGMDKQQAVFICPDILASGIQCPCCQQGPNMTPTARTGYGLTSPRPHLVESGMVIKTPVGGKTVRVLQKCKEEIALRASDASSAGMPPFF